MPSLTWNNQRYNQINQYSVWIDVFEPEESIYLLNLVTLTVLMRGETNIRVESSLS